jgi:hypothetical protein
MGGSLGSELFLGDLEQPCPECGIDIWLRYSEVMAGVPVRCSCCRTLVRFVSDDGSASTVVNEVDARINQMIECDLDAMLDILRGFS